MTRTIFFSSIMTETNSFSNFPTTLADFYEGDYATGNDVLYDVDGKLRAGAKVLKELVEAAGFTLVGGLLADASPAAPMPHEDYLSLKKEYLNHLKASMPVSAVFLNLHGAMQSDGCTDCEGDILKSTRRIVGPDVPIGAVLDPHAHLTEEMVEYSDILSFMKEYPHIDGLERIEDVATVLLGMLQGECKPVASFLNCKTLGFYPTQDQPMRGFVDEMISYEQCDDVLSVSLIHGFPWGDVPEQGTKILAYTNNDIERAEQICSDLKRKLWDIRHDIGFEPISVTEMLRIVQDGAEKPLIFGDVSDNPGGGAAGDSTFILKELLEAGVEGVAIGLIYDPEAVKASHTAGVGNIVSLSIGGKISIFSGDPVVCEAEVMAISKDARMTVIEGVTFPMGDTAWVRVGGINIVLASQREQAYAPDSFGHLGLDPASQKVIVVKSTNHFTAFFSTISDHMFFVNSPGAISYEFKSLPFKRFKANYYPLVENPDTSE